MKRLAIGSLEIALVLGCGVGSALAWGPPPGGGGAPTIGNLLKPPAPPMVYPDDKPADKPATQAKPPADPPLMAAEPAPERKPASRPSVVDQAAAVREQEMQTLLRRQKVCLQLMQIAEETNDPELQRKAEQLDERAREIYTQRTSTLPAARAVGFESDEKTLQQHLGSTNRDAANALRSVEGQR